MSGIHKRYPSIFIFFLSLATSLWGYHFGFFDHQEHLPLLMRMQDKGFLANDFFINANYSGYDPRYYSSNLILGLASITGLPLSYFLLNFICNWILGWSSYECGRLFFQGSKLAGLWAASLVLTVKVSELGSVASLHLNYLTPNGMAFCLVLMAFVFILKQRWLTAGLLLGCSSLIHPLVGPESGLLLFGTVFFLTITERSIKRKELTKIGLAFSLFLAIAALHLLPYFNADQVRIPDKEFIEIYANFRAPHHILPSHFMINEEPKNAVFLLLLFALLWINWFGTGLQARKAQWLVLLLSLGLIFMALMGYIFTELYPKRLFITAQTFRLLYILKWLLLILLGGFSGHLFYKGAQLDKLYAIGLLCCSFVYPQALYLLAFRAVSLFLRRRLNLPQSVIIIEIAGLLILSIHGIQKAFNLQQVEEDFFLWLLMLVLFIVPSFFAIGRKIQAAVWSILLIAWFGYWIQTPRTAAMSKWHSALSRQFSLEDIDSEMAQLSKKIQQLCPEDALLIAPPMCSEIRYLAKRALVVDFKTFPFGDQAMKEWRKRIAAVYGWTDLKGFNAVQWGFEPNFRNIKLEKLKDLSVKYGARYAILYRETHLALPILFETAHYQLVYIPEKS